MNKIAVAEELVKVAKMLSGMRDENQRMQQWLKAHGIDARVKYISTGSLKGTWRLYNPAVQWSEELGDKLTRLGFSGFDGRPFHRFSGNGGVFSVFVRGHKEMLDDNGITAKEKKAMDFPTQDAMDKYLKDHPDANRSNHKVVKKEEGRPETHPINLMRQRKNEEKMNEIGKHYKKDPKDLTIDEIEKYNKGKKAEFTVEKNASSNKTSKEVESMSRERITSRKEMTAEVLGALSVLRKALTAADDAELTQWADELAKQEKEVVQKNVPDAVLKDDGDQNAKANANWPLTEEEKMTVANTLVKLAKELVK